ncbi:MAG: divergent polysaccharide deacetylase family protein, partial [Alphaproteobacteria bacterium]|nr:divergent polysaccharide deacetylase family protein [Alphaproteobacteria bacterium]
DWRRRRTAPWALTTEATPAENLRNLEWALGRFDGYVGINNHMGSRFTANSAALRPILAEINRRGLLFLDSRTTAESVAIPLARGLGLPHAGRDVFLDDDAAPEAIRAKLGETEAIARRNGHAIAIGHPRDATLAALGAWLPEVERRGFVLVPLSAVVRRNGEARGG